MVAVMLQVPETFARPLEGRPSSISGEHVLTLSGKMVWEAAIEEELAFEREPHNT